MNKRWSDYLFTAAVRIVCGLLIGGAAGLLIGWRVILREGAREHIRFVVIWLSVWAVGGAVVAFLPDSVLAETVVQGNPRLG